MTDPGENVPRPSGAERNANLYDTKHAFVWEYGSEVVALLDPRAGERVLDVGCGESTGGVRCEPLSIWVEYISSSYRDAAIERAAAGGRSAPSGFTTAATRGPAPGWYADPYARHELRYFDGLRWTDNVANGGVPGNDPAR